ncbi:MAG TPA: hypothetical protein VHM19_20230, partial [Polyangiales bacterium]|nr:hypothetical protein [Polyangiales bacterium]
MRELKVSLLSLGLVSLVGCAPSCSCDGGKPGAHGASPSGLPSPVPAAAGSGGSGAAPSVASAGTGGAPADWMKRMESYFPDLPLGKQRERVEEVRTRLQKAVPAPVEKLATRVDLERFLPGDLYGMSAVQAIEEAPAKVGRVSVTALSRVFRSGEREAYVRVVDAGQAPDFRTQVLGEMSGLGDEHQGYAHGRLVAGYPAVATYFPKAASSRVVAIVGN